MHQQMEMVNDAVSLRRSKSHCKETAPDCGRAREALGSETLVHRTGECSSTFI